MRHQADSLTSLSNTLLRKEMQLRNVVFCHDKKQTAQDC